MCNEDSQHCPAHSFIEGPTEYLKICNTSADRSMNKETCRDEDISTPYLQIYRPTLKRLSECLGKHESDRTLNASQQLATFRRLVWCHLTGWWTWPGCMHGFAMHILRVARRTNIDALLRPIPAVRRVRGNGLPKSWHQSAWDNVAAQKALWMSSTFWKAWDQQIGTSTWAEAGS